MSWLGIVLAVALGISAVVFGGYDDSPGLQGIGVLLVLAGIVLAVRTVRRTRRGH